MSVLDNMMKFQATKKSPLELLKDSRRQAEADNLKKQQVMAEQALTAMKLRQAQQEIDSANKLKQLELRIPPEASPMQKAKIYANSGFTKQAELWADVANKESIMADRREDNVREENRLKAQEERAAEENADRDASRAIREKELGVKERRAAIAEEQLQIERDREARIRQQEQEQADRLRKKYETEIAEKNYGFVNQAIMASGIPTKTVGSGNKQKTVPDISPENVKYIRNKAADIIQNDKASPLEIQNEFNTRFQTVQADISGGYLKEGVVVPREFYAKLKAKGEDDSDIGELFIEILKEIQSGHGSLSPRTERILKKAGFRKKEILEMFF